MKLGIMSEELLKEHKKGTDLISAFFMLYELNYKLILALVDALGTSTLIVIGV